MPCINRDPNSYQIAALGASQENGKTYDQIMLGNVATVRCGHS